MITNPFLKQNNSCGSAFCFVLFGVIIVFFFVWFSVVSAAEIFFSVPPTDIPINKEFQVEVLLSTEVGESINAIEGGVIFPAEIIKYIEASDGNSIINFWIKKPELNIRKDVNIYEILFSGIIPGGFDGKNGRLFRLTFQPIRETEGDLSFSYATKAFLNSPDSQIANLVLKKSNLVITPESSNKEFFSGFIPTDTSPPEEFKPEIVRDENIFDGKWFLVFTTQDKESGISHYEVYELPQTLGQTLKVPKKWKRTESPHLLSDQELKSYIYVKAVDKTGNERIVMLPPQNQAAWYENYIVLGIILLVIVAGYIIRRILWKKSYTKTH